MGIEATHIPPGTWGGTCLHGVPFGRYCGSCTSAPQVAPPHMNWPASYPTTSAVHLKGWECPGCKSCYAPHVSKCPDCPKPEQCQINTPQAYINCESAAREDTAPA